jgi:hypothetical protein
MKRDQKHPPKDPETEKLPVEPEMQKGLDPRESGRAPESEPEKESAPTTSRTENWAPAFAGATASVP